MRPKHLRPWEAGLVAFVTALLVLAADRSFALPACRPGRAAALRPGAALGHAGHHPDDGAAAGAEEPGPVAADGAEVHPRFDDGTREARRQHHHEEMRRRHREELLRRREERRRHLGREPPAGGADRHAEEGHGREGGAPPHEHGGQGHDAPDAPHGEGVALDAAQIAPRWDAVRQAQGSVFPWLPDVAAAEAGGAAAPAPRHGSLEVDGHTLHWRVAMSKPRAMYLSHFADAGEVAAIKAAAAADLARSRVVGADGAGLVNSVRTSEGTFLVKPDQVAIPEHQAVRARVAALVGVPVVNIEGTQILRYQPGQFYRAHPDYFMSTDKTNLHRGGQRFATVVLWLNDVASGGGTTFPMVGQTLVPRMGDAVCFYSMTPGGEIDPLSQHAGDPPGAGSEKWIAVFWVRPHRFT